MTVSQVIPKDVTVTGCDKKTDKKNQKTISVTKLMGGCSDVNSFD